MKASAGLRYEGALARHGHVESWFLKANDPQSRRAVWLKWTVWAGDRAPTAAIAEAWAVAFSAKSGHVAAKVAVPFGGGLTRFDRDGLGVSIDGCTLSRERALGRVETGERAIEYDLRIEALAEPLLHFPSSWMYARPWPAQKLASPVPNARVSGRVDVDGDGWAVEGWPAMVGHNWGRRHSSLYAWGQCNAWDGGDDLVLEGASIGGGGPVLGGTILCLRHEGVRHDLNGLRSIARNGGAITPRRWRFRGRSARVEVEGEMWADTDDFVGLLYPNPDGTNCHCLNTKLARTEVTLKFAGRPARMYQSSRGALEIGTSDPHHGVRMVL
jgi:tocopherol cyclase-like protein